MSWDLPSNFKTITPEVEQAIAQADKAGLLAIDDGGAGSLQWCNVCKKHNAGVRIVAFKTDEDFDVGNGFLEINVGRTCLKALIKKLNLVTKVRKWG